MGFVGFLTAAAGKEKKKKEEEEEGEHRRAEKIGHAGSGGLVLHNRKWMECRVLHRPPIEFAWRGGRVATPFLYALPTESADIAYALCVSEGEGIREGKGSEIGE